jgi:hypothetical protein
MVSEVSTEFDVVSRVVNEVRGLGASVAIHALTESEFVVALDVLSHRAGSADRIEPAALECRMSTSHPSGAPDSALWASQD